MKTQTLTEDQIRILCETKPIYEEFNKCSYTAVYSHQIDDHDYIMVYGIKSFGKLEYSDYVMLNTKTREAFINDL